MRTLRARRLRSVIGSAHSQTVSIEVNRTDAGTRPLDARLFLRDEELDHGAALIVAGERALAAAVRGALKDAGLNLAELHALITIRTQPGLTVSDLRSRLAATTPTMARVLGALDRRGWIERARAQADGRRRRLKLTQAGEDAAEPLAAAMRDALRDAYRAAGAEHVAGARAVLTALAGPRDDV